MTISVVFIVRDRSLGNYIGRLKSSVIPPELRKSGYFSGRDFSVATMIADPNDTTIEGQLSTFFSTVLDTTREIVVLSDALFKQQVERYSAVYFLHFFDMNELRANVQNFLGAICARALRAFQYLSRCFENEKYRKTLLLPLANFRAPEIQLLLGILSGEKLTGFADRLELYLKKMRARQSPKRDDPGEGRAYLVDDLGRHFSYGLERHGEPATGIPPHKFTCVAATSFRFGIRFDKGRHYNVSLDGSLISGRFANCHGHQADEKGTHINMYPNGYYTVKND